MSTDVHTAETVRWGCGAKRCSEVCGLSCTLKRLNTHIYTPARRTRPILVARAILALILATVLFSSGLCYS